MDDDIDFTKEDKGRYRHTEIVAGYLYADLEKRVLAAIDADVRTLPRIKTHASLPTGFDLSEVVEGMELDRKIRRESNGTITAFFRYEQMPKRFWLNGDGTVGAEFIEAFVPSKPAVDRKAEEAADRSRGRQPRPVDPAELERLAGEMRTMQDIAEALQFSLGGFRIRVKQDKTLRDAYDRGRKLYAEKQAALRPPPKAEPTSQEPRKTTLREAAATDTATAPKRIQWTTEMFRTAASEGLSRNRLAKKLGVDHTTIGYQLNNNPEFEKAWLEGRDEFVRGLDDDNSRIDMALKRSLESPVSEQPRNEPSPGTVRELENPPSPNIVVGDLVIEKGIPMPAPTRASVLFETLSRMDIGDSVFVANATKDSLKWALVRVRKEKKFEFVSQSEKGGRRVWRRK